ncbi:GNAT family N-acetyltransferase [Labrys neptuniae]
MDFDRETSEFEDSSPSNGMAMKARSTDEPRSPKKKDLFRVRLVEEADWPAIRALVRKHHERTMLAHLPFSESKFDTLEKRLRAARNDCILVAERKNELIGVAWASAGEYLLCEDSLMATAHLIAVDRKACGAYLSAKVFIRLLRGITLWARSVGAKQTLVHVTTGMDIKAADRILRAGGATCIGGSYVV